MTTDDLAWTAEEACQNAWPSPRQVLLEGWLLRASGGQTRRTNSVNPLRSGPRDPSRIVAAAEGIYRSIGQSALFRVPSIVAEMDGPLERQGYVAEGETCTIFADLAGHRTEHDGTIELSEDPSEEWLTARTAMNPAESADAAGSPYRQMVGSIVLPKAFVARRVDGALVAIAYGAIHDQLLVVESVGTHPDHRQRGHAARTVSGLMGWAKSRGIQGCCLQVVADNSAARALYRSLGFGTELSRYHYRRQPAAG
jgi:ribosomal protein S18 acetylase RimI-like enzyme